MDASGSDPRPSARAERSARRAEQQELRAQQLRAEAAARGADEEEQEEALRLEEALALDDDDDDAERAIAQRARHAEWLKSQLQSATVRRCAGRAESAQRAWMYWISSVVYQANRADGAGAQAFADDPNLQEDIVAGPDDLRRRSSGGFSRQRVALLNDQPPPFDMHKDASAEYAQALYDQARSIVAHAGVALPEGTVEPAQAEPPPPPNAEWRDASQILWAYRAEADADDEDDTGDTGDALVLYVDARTILLLARDWTAQFAQPPPEGGHYTACPFYPVRMPVPARDAYDAQMRRSGMDVRRRRALEGTMSSAVASYVAGVQPAGGGRRLQRDEFGLPRLDPATGARLEQAIPADELHGPAHGSLRRIKAAANGRFLRNVDGSYVMVPTRRLVVHATDTVHLVVRPIRLNEHHWEWQWARWLKNAGMVEPASLLPHVRARDNLSRARGRSEVRYVEGSSLALPLMTPVPVNHLGVEVRDEAFAEGAAGAAGVAGAADGDPVRGLVAALAPRPFVTEIPFNDPDTPNRLERLLPRLWQQRPEAMFKTAVETARREGHSAWSIGVATDAVRGPRFCVVWQAREPGAGGTPLAPNALVLFRRVDDNENQLVFDSSKSRASDCWHINATGVPGDAYAQLVETIRRPLPGAGLPPWHRHFYGEPLVRTGALGDDATASQLVDVRLCATYGSRVTGSANAARLGNKETRAEILRAGEQNRLYSEVHSQVCFAPLPLRTCATLPVADYVVPTTAAAAADAATDAALEGEYLKLSFPWTLTTNTHLSRFRSPDDVEDDADEAGAERAVSAMVPARALGDAPTTRGRFAPPVVHPRLRRDVGPLYPEVTMRRDHGSNWRRIRLRANEVERALQGERMQWGSQAFTDAERAELERLHPILADPEEMADQAQLSALLATVDAQFGFAAPKTLEQALDRFVREAQPQLDKYPTADGTGRLAPTCNRPGGLYVAARMDTGTGPGEGGVDSMFPMPKDASVYSLADVNMVRGVHEYLRNPEEPLPDGKGADEWKASRARWGEPHWFKEEMREHDAVRQRENLTSEARASLHTLQFDRNTAYGLPGSDRRGGPLDKARTLTASLGAVERDAYASAGANATPTVALHQRQRLDAARIGRFEERAQGLKPGCPAAVGSATAKILWEAWNVPPATYRGGAPGQAEPRPQYRMPARIPYYQNPQRDAPMALMTIPETEAATAAAAAAVPGRPDLDATRLPHQSELLAAPTPLSICPNRLQRSTRRSLFERMQDYDGRSTPDVSFGWRGQGVLAEGMEGYVPPSADAPSPLMSATRDAAAEQRADAGPRSLVAPTYVLLLDFDDVQAAMRAGDRDWHALMSKYPNYWRHCDAYELLPYQVGDEQAYVLRPNSEYIEPAKALPERAEGTWETFDAPPPEYAGEAEVRCCTRPRERMRASWFRDRKLWGAPAGSEADETRANFEKKMALWERTYNFGNAMRDLVAHTAAIDSDLRQLQHAVRYSTVHLCWFAAQFVQEGRASPPAPLPACVRDRVSPAPDDPAGFDNYRILEELLRLSDFATNAYEIRWTNHALNEIARKTLDHYNALSSQPAPTRLSLRQRRCAGHPHYEALLTAIETDTFASWPGRDKVDALFRGAAPRYVQLLKAVFLQIPGEYRDRVRKAAAKALNAERSPAPDPDALAEGRTLYTKRRYGTRNESDARDPSNAVGSALDAEATTPAPDADAEGGADGSFGARVAYAFVSQLLAYDPEANPTHVAEIAEPLLSWKWAPVLSAFLDACTSVVMKKLVRKTLNTYQTDAQGRGQFLDRQMLVRHLFYFATDAESRAYAAARRSGRPPPQLPMELGQVTLESSAYRRTPRRVRTTRMPVAQLDDPVAFAETARNQLIQGPHADLDVLRQLLYVFEGGTENPARAPNLEYHDQLIVVDSKLAQSWLRRPRRPFAPGQLVDRFVGDDSEQALGASLEAVSQLCNLLAMGDELGQRILDALNGVDTDAETARVAFDATRFQFSAVGSRAAASMQRALAVVAGSDLGAARREAAQQQEADEGEAVVRTEMARLHSDLRLLHARYERALAQVRLRQARLLQNVFKLSDAEVGALNEGDGGGARAQLLERRGVTQYGTNDYIDMAIPGGTEATDRIRTELKNAEEEWENADTLQQIANYDMDTRRRLAADARLGVYEIVEALEVARRSLARMDDAKRQLGTIQRYSPDQRRAWARQAKGQRQRLGAARRAREKRVEHDIERSLYLLFREADGAANPNYPNPDAERDAAAAAAEARTEQRVAKSTALRTLQEMNSRVRTEERDAKRREYERQYLEHLPVRREWLKWMKELCSVEHRQMVRAWNEATSASAEELADPGPYPTASDALRRLRTKYAARFDPAQTPGCKPIPRPRWWRKGLRPLTADARIDPANDWEDTEFAEDDAWLQGVYAEYAQQSALNEAQQPQYQPQGNQLAAMVSGAREARAHQESLEERMVEFAEEFVVDYGLVSDLREAEANVDASLGPAADAGADADADDGAGVGVGVGVGAVPQQPILDLGAGAADDDEVFDPPLQAGRPEAEPELVAGRGRSSRPRLAASASGADGVAAAVLEAADASATIESESATGRACLPPRGVARSDKAAPSVFVLSKTVGQCTLDDLLEQIVSASASAEARRVEAEAAWKAAAGRIAEDERVLSDALPYAQRLGPQTDPRMELAALNEAVRTAPPYPPYPPALFSPDSRRAGGWRAGYHDYVRRFADIVGVPLAEGHAVRREALLATVPLTPVQWRRSVHGRGPHPPRRSVAEQRELALALERDAAPCPDRCPAADDCAPPCAPVVDARIEALLAGEAAFFEIAGPWAIYGFDFAPIGPTSVVEGE